MGTVPKNVNGAKSITHSEIFLKKTKLERVYNKNDQLWIMKINSTRVRVSVLEFEYNNLKHFLNA